MIHPLTRSNTLVANPDRVYADALNRERGNEPEVGWVVDGLIPYGVTLVIADPGAGKSMVVQQVLHHLCYGRPLGDWDSPGMGGHLALVFDLEGDATLTRDRGYSITPWGELEQDGRGDARTDLYLWVKTAVVFKEEGAEGYYATYRHRANAHLAYLADTLTDAEAAGAPITVVVVDTLAKFMGPRPKDSNAYEWEAAAVGELNRLATDHRAAIIVIHHTNKAGEVSGSTGIAGSATVAMKLETTQPDDECEPVTGVLRSMKVRNGRPFAYPMVQRHDGTWTFTAQQSATIAAAYGQKRMVLRALEDGPKTKSELMASTGLAAGIAKVLDRLKREGSIRSAFGRWQLVETSTPLPGPAPRTCTVCGGVMLEIHADWDRHPLCDETSTTTTAPVPVLQLVPDAQGDEDDDAAEAPNGFRMMNESLDASRMHPVRRIPVDQREAGPWPFMSERMTGEHRWRVQPDGPGLVAVLDRNGSYPSAAGSVPVAANVLGRTGTDLPEKHAGIYRIDHVTWTDPRIGHPLGRIADHDGDWWITTPHLILLQRLALRGLIEAPTIRDSWTGKPTTGLFTSFSKAVQDARLAARERSADEYVAVKRTSSIAIRSLWPKGARSPFWRPDWSLSIRAEAAVRHWIRAHQAVEGGAVCLGLSTIDEVAFLAPADSDRTWVPEPYVLGIRYGEVKHKDDVLVGGEPVASPLTVEQWGMRGRRGPR